ncbi:TM2 domain-containing protein [Mucilaginibacter sp. L3T2-6]|uniref:TM2 domain-containing protein n=1 Tax=Mucilaginibacter sp. L3T2-6 TaxID=3062491 RepID=UPI00267650DB|nr:TM2 domain-containing protein [Mucilaginibacter sp. L3T2-6]MDO3643882.1 TM2 domain-containing protein [Mucilaginibacter sp. L3T2-6]MDV6216395.1 TM2 domain-containing protein [Mucilaginibacter sp. L3T2-6]
MDMYQNPYIAFPGITSEEMFFLQQGTAGLNENQKKQFYMVYSGKRKSAQDILIFTIIGFFGVAGIQRFALNEVVMGLLYLFTFGFCMIGTIIDVVNHKTLADDYNRKMAFESLQIAKMMPGFDA